MAVPKKRDESWDDLVARAAAEVRQANPHIGAEPEPYPEDDYAKLVEDARQLKRIWDEIDQERGNRPQSYTVADAVNEDRGE
ncbi:MAG TPA: hypothetical protein VH349_07385 [Ktedonobacterales bacterium]